MILHGSVVEQFINNAEKAHFVKEIIIARGSVPLALVRKRACIAQTGSDSGAGDQSQAAPTRASVLLIHGYGQNRYAFHLPSRSLVNYLARLNFDVYNIDLRGRGRSAHLGARRPANVEDFIKEDVPIALNEIRTHSPKNPIFLVGHSLGGVISYAVAADYKKKVAGVVTIGSPYHFTVGSKWLTRLAEAFLFLDRKIEFPNIAVPARWYGKLVRNVPQLVNSRLYPLPLQGFRRDSIETEILHQHMALAMDRGSLATMREMFAWAKRARGQTGSSKNRLFGYERSFEELDMPLLVLSGRYDDLAPPASVKPAFLRSQSRHKTYRELPFGHVDLLVGRQAPVLVWPLLGAWLEQQVARLEKTGGQEAA